MLIYVNTTMLINGAYTHNSLHEIFRQTHEYFITFTVKCQMYTNMLRTGIKCITDR